MSAGSLILTLIVVLVLGILATIIRGIVKGKGMKAPPLTDEQKRRAAEWDED